MKISIILVVYKTLEWIEDCLDSIFDQSYKDFELIIISNDDDPEMDETIRRLISGKDNVNYILNKKNTGGASACNQGIRLARGEYVFLMDSDDLLPADALKHLADTAEKTGSDIVIGRGKIVRNGKTHNVDYRPDWISWERTLTVNSISEAPYLSFNPYYWGRLYRRSMLTDKGVFLADGAVNADRNFNCRALIAASSISVTPQNTYLWRKHATSENHKSITQSRMQRKNFHDRVKMMKKTDKEFKKTGNKELYHYSRISGLMRLLILAKDTTADLDFRNMFLRTMRRYLRSFSYNQISGCEFMTYRVKTLAYLIKSGDFSGFDRFIREELEITSNKVNNKIIYSYLELDVPEEFRTQNIFHLSVVKGELAEQATDGIYIRGCAELSEGCIPDPVGIYLMNEKKEEVIRIDVGDNSVSDGKLFFTAKVTNDIMETLNKERYYFTLYYVVHLRVGRTKITDASGETLYLQIR